MEGGGEKGKRVGRLIYSFIIYRSLVDDVTITSSTFCRTNVIKITVYVGS